MERKNQSLMNHASTTIQDLRPEEKKEKKKFTIN